VNLVWQANLAYLKDLHADMHMCICINIIIKANGAQHMHSIHIFSETVYVPSQSGVLKLSRLKANNHRYHGSMIRPIHDPAGRSMIRPIHDPISQYIERSVLTVD
jgi:hypothetical protein